MGTLPIDVLLAKKNPCQQIEFYRMCSTARWICGACGTLGGLEWRGNMIAVTPEFLDIDETQILFWNFQSLDASRSPQEQPDDLKEDLGQVVLGPGVLLDIGWYPRLDPAGGFVVVAVREGEWEDPIARHTATDWAGLVSAVAKVRAVARVNVLERQR